MEAIFVRSGKKVSAKVAELFVKIGIAKWNDNVTDEVIDDEKEVTEPVLKNIAIPKQNKEPKVRKKRTVKVKK